MNSWQFFEFLFETFDTRFLQAVQGMITAVVAAVHTPLLLSVSVYIGSIAAMELYQPSSDPLFMLFRKVIRAAIVIFAVTAANYTNGIATLLLTTLPNDLTAVITGAGGNGQLAPEAFDRLWGGAWAAGNQVYANIAGWSLKGILLMLMIGGYWFLSGLAILAAFMVFIVSHILLGLLIATGPFFIPFLLFERTYGYFSGWLATVLSLIVTQMFTVGLLALFLPVIGQILLQVGALNNGTGLNARNEMAQLHYLIEAGLLFVALTYLTSRIPPLAQAVMGGVAADLGPVARMAHAAIGDTGRATAAIARAAGHGSGGGAPSKAMGLRDITPAGRSLG